MTVIVRSDPQIIVAPSGVSGAQGPPGPAGSGSTIGVKDHGSLLSSIVERLNIAGAGVTVSGSGADITVTIPGGLSVPTPQQYGAAADGSTDDSAETQAAISGVTASPITGFGYGGGGGARLFVPKGVYNQGTTTFDITTGFIIQGESPGLLGPGVSVLKWNAATTGLRTQATNTTGATGVLGSPRSTDGRLSAKNLALVSSFSSESEAHGIHARITFDAQDLFIDSFAGDGIHAVGSPGEGAPNEGNVDCVSMRRVLVQRCRNGFFFDGSGANAGTFVDLNAILNRQWGFWDSGFLGNCYVGGHMDSNGLVSGYPPSVVSHSGNRYAVIKGQETGASTNAPSGTTADNTWWYYIGAGGTSPANNINAWTSGTTYRAGGAGCTDDPSALHTIVGMYTESGQGPLQVSAQTLVVGGAHFAGVRGGAWIRAKGNRFFTDAPIQTESNLFARGASHEIGPQSGTQDATTNLDHSNSSHVLQSRFWSGGSPTNGASLGFYASFGIIANAPTGQGHRVRVNNADIHITDVNGLDLQSGKVLKVNGTQVVGAQQTGTPADATDLATALTLVNALKAKLIAHGLLA